MQADLGDLFLESALGAQRNTFLLETHSEHLILRIMRRIAAEMAGAVASMLQLASTVILVGSVLRT